MNTLTKNRIIEKGDEFLDGEKWKPVPKDDIGLQIMFSKYTEVRRPSEKPFTPSTNGESRTAGQSDKIATPRRAETTPAPTSGAGDTPPPYAAAKAEQDKAIAVKLAQSEREIEANGLPTVVSRKAHIKGEVIHGISTKDAIKALRETPETSKDATTEVAKSPASPTPSTVKVLPSKAVQINWPVPDELDTKWIGRNGTFKNRALNLHVREELMGSIIQIVPVGKRGKAKNALIEFPVSAIPQVIDYLALMHREATKV